MILFLLPFVASAALLQFAASAAIANDTAHFIATAGVLGSLTVLVYRLGVWRQEMENTKHNVGAELRSYRKESGENFERIERRLDALDRLISDSIQFKTRASRWQTNATRRIQRLEESSK